MQVYLITGMVRAFDQQYYLTDGKGNSIHNTDSIDHSITAFLNQYGKEKPFCLSVSFKAPHELDGNLRIYPVQQKFKSLYPNDTAREPLTANPKKMEESRIFFSHRQKYRTCTMGTVVFNERTLPANCENYYRLISGVDEVVGKMMNQLKNMGIDKNTIIIFMGDNGFCLGEHGLEGKWYGYEECIRVPLIVYDPRPSSKYDGTKNADIALNIDIALLFLLLQELKDQAVCRGENLIDIL